MIEIFKYIDRIFAMIRPRKLLFMAIDGVAPRAKMNQQRSRRFRAARERREKSEREAELRDELPGGDDDGDDEVEGGAFDSNCITPGTKFMALVASSIRYYIVERMNREPAWRQVKVIFSDANVPGEGEHKIMDYIRRQRLDPDYDPNTRHVIYGLDADLIMLSMATHEPYFRVLREDVFWEEQLKYTPCSYCGVKGHAAESCPEKLKNDPSFVLPPIQAKPFIFLDVAILREYLEAELKPNTQLPFKWNFERALDDWIFLCFFVGNDFLPHLPSLEIREGAIDLLMDIYKSNAVKMGGFICQDGVVDLSRVQYIMDDLAQVEERIFQKRREKEERKNENIKRRKVAAAPRSMEAADGKMALEQQRTLNLAAAQALKAQLAEDEEPYDEVRLWEVGARDRYYQSKFFIDPQDQNPAIRPIVKSYVEGLCWVMAYYYQGCPSWKWFYPYHYSPLVRDMKDVATITIDFELGEPFRPYDQLMGVFPAESRELVPAPFRPLMTGEDPTIADFYPTDFAIDLNGKRHAWQGIVLLPFIDEGRLLAALESAYQQLTPQELKMNIRGEDRVYFSLWHPVTGSLMKALDDSLHAVPLDPQETGGLAGYVKRDDEFPSPGGSLESPLPEQGCPDLNDLQVACFIYFVPYHERKSLRHKSLLLPRAVFPERMLTEEDVELVRSGTASRRVPGRLILQTSFGQHSMHREHAREYDRGEGRGYEREGKGYERRERSPDRRRDDRYERREVSNRRNNDRYDGRNQRHGPPQAAYYPPPPGYPISGFPVPMHPNSMPGFYPPPSAPLPLQNRFDALTPQGPVQPALGVFHRGPPRPPSGDMDNFYGRYPPPSN